MHRITSIKVLPTANTAATLIFVLGIVAAILFAGPVWAFQGASFLFTWGFDIALPFIIALGGWVLTIVLCVVYNTASRLLGGFTFELKQE
jgi:hypothetical protein